MTTLTSSFAIGYVNHANGKTITATTSATGYPASNLNSPSLSLGWKSTSGSLTNQNLDVDLGSSKDVDLIALIGTNLREASATRSPVMSENSNYSSPEYNPGSASAFDTTYPPLADDTPPYGRNLIVLPPSTLNARYGRLTVSDSGHTDNYLSGRVLWFGPIWQPLISFPCKEGSFKKRRDPVGVPGMERGLRVMDVQLDVLSEAEGRALESICGERLRSRRLIVIPRPDQPATWASEVLYCTLGSLPTLTGWPQGAGEILWKVQLTFKECED